jgi:type I restriction enzyme S subunit
MVNDKYEEVTKHFILPLGWNKKKIGEIGSIVTGNTPKTSEQENYGDDFLWVSPIDMGEIKYITETKKMLTRTGFDKTRKVPMGAVLVTCIGSTIGKIGIASRELSTNQQINSVIVDDDNHNEYVYYAIDFNFKEYKNFISNQAVPIINKTQFSEFTIPSPPLSEQRKIAAILTSVDNAIEKTEAIIKQTEVVKQGLMQRLLTKGIGHTKFKQTEIGEIPNNWSICTLKDFCEHITKGATPTTYGFNWTETGIRFLRSECVKESGLTFEGANYISDEAHEAMKRSVIRGGDLLVSITGNIGRGCIYPESYPEANINQHIARVRVVKSELLNPNFLMYYINSEPVRRHFYLIKTGQAYPQISLKQVQDLKIPLPSIEEQKKIASILGAFDLKIQTELKTVELLIQLKNSLMQDLLTGKVRVNVNESSKVSV